MHTSLPVDAVVFHIFRPRFTFHIDECVCLRFGEVNHHKGRQVAGLIRKGEVIPIDPTRGVVADGSDVLLVGRVLTRSTT